ncbi:MAG: MBL fold metallo-hydrolase [Gemmatimonadetes bacterium]|nr:MBL fold metallo-hydrolase [Gemmatimonadota bacterium]
MRVQAVRPGIHVVSGFENGNVLVLASDTGLLLVDAQSHQRVSALDRALAGLLGGRSPHRVRAVVNTHYHGDHTEGNAFFRQLGATVIAHRNAAMQAAKDTTIAEWDNWHRTPLAPAAMPTQLVEDSAAFDFGAAARGPRARAACAHRRRPARLVAARQRAPHRRHPRGGGATVHRLVGRWFAARDGGDDRSCPADGERPHHHRSRARRGGHARRAAALPCHAAGGRGACVGQRGAWGVTAAGAGRAPGA